MSKTVTEETGAAAVKVEKPETPTVAPTSVPTPTFWDDPFGFMVRFNEEFDRFFNDIGLLRRRPDLGWLVPRTFAEAAPAMWSPQIEIVEKEGKLMVKADLPGVKRDDVKVEIRDNLLVLRGERKDEREEKKEGFYRSERSYGSFLRSIPLPKGTDVDSATAMFRDGVLEITIDIPKLEKPVGKEVVIS
jgi:HSP20 family protein